MSVPLRMLLRVAGFYVGAQILSDIASLRILSLFGWSVDGGTLIYPVTFTLRDLVHKLGGKDAARTVVVSAAVLNLFMALFFWFVGVLPPDPAVGPQLAFGELLSPVWRLVIASIVAELVSELADGEVYDLWVRFHGPRRQWLRVLVSNSVSLPLDSLVFGLGAFAFDLEWPVVWSIVASNVALKLLVTLISLPWIYAVPDGNPEISSDRSAAPPAGGSENLPRR